MNKLDNYKHEIKDGVITIYDKGDIDITDSNLEGELNCPNATSVYCSFNNFTSVTAPVAEKVFCTRNQLISVTAPMARTVYCHNNKQLTSVIHNCYRQNINSRHFHSMKA